MGIRGLETFLERIYTSPNRSMVYTDMKLKDLRLVIDGNQFSYFLSSLFALNRTGGAYDLYYSKLKSLLSPLAPSIEVVIFDGCKEFQAKARRRLDSRCEQLNNLGNEFKNIDEYERFLCEFPAVFNRCILYEVLGELGVKVRMTLGAADHVIALYANGYNESGEKFTVVSKASFFNIYNLEKGYVCSKHLSAIFKAHSETETDLASTTVPVFHLSSLLSYFCLDSPLTWLYFCILCGNNDDPELSRNYKYFEENHVDSRDFTHLIAHIKLNENHLRALDKMDELIDLFEMKAHEYKFMTPMNEKLTDYDRLFSTVRQTGANYIPNMIENAHDDSVYAAANDIIRAVYASIWYRFGDTMKSVLDNGKLREYRRAKAHENCAPQIRLRHVNLQDDVNMNEYGSFVKFFELIREADNKVVASSSHDDNLTIFMACLVFWEKWLDFKFKTSSYLVKSSDFKEALLLNLILVAAKRSHQAATQFDTITQSISKDDAHELSLIYDRLSSKAPANVDIKLIHSLNEFQAIYYYTGALCEIKSLQIKPFLPSCFYNANFLLRFMASKQHYMNNNDENELLLNDVKLIQEKTEKCMAQLNNIYQSIRDHVDKMGLDELPINPCAKLRDFLKCFSDSK